MNKIYKVPVGILIVIIIFIAPLILFSQKLSVYRIPNKAKSLAVEEIVLTTKVTPNPEISATVTTQTFSVRYASTSGRGEAEYINVINAAALEYNVSTSLLESILSCESGYNPNAYNPSGASGIAQFMPSTFYGSWNPYRSEGLWNPDAQIYAMALKISEGGLNAWVCR